MRWLSDWLLVVLVLMLGAVSAQAGLPAPSARLLFFTDDTLESGTPLLPGFLHHSVWSGLGAASNGRLYVAVSNHQQPGGNVALYEYDPVADQMTLLGDIEAISSAVGNWMHDEDLSQAESQYKVHSFLLEHADGSVYFASDDHDPTPFLRGAHLYRIDPSTAEVEDYSKTQPFLLTDELVTIPNPGLAAEQSGVFIETYGIKGIGLNPAAPDLLYAMTWPDGHLIRHDLGTGSMQVIGQSPAVSYVFYVDASGNVFYTVDDGTQQILLRYDAASGQTSEIASGIATGEVGAIAPSADGAEVYFLIANTKEIYRLRPATGSFELLIDLDSDTAACGSNWWRLYNLSLSPDGRTLYYVSNNNSHSWVRKLDLETLQCSGVLDVDALLGTRNLAFGGVNVWDADGNLYVPVWTFDPPPGQDDVALLQIALGELPPPQPLPSATGTGSVLLALVLVAAGRSAFPGPRDGSGAGRVGVLLEVVDE